MPSVPEVAARRWTASPAIVAALLVALIAGAIGVLPSVAGGAENSRICNSHPGASIPSSFFIDACFNGSAIVLDNRSALPLRANTTPYVAQPSRSSLGLINELASQVLIDIDPGDPYLLPPGTRLIIPTGASGNKISIQRLSSDHEAAYFMAEFLTELPGPNPAAVADEFVSIVNALTDEFHKFWDCRNRNNWIGNIGCDTQTFAEIQGTLVYHTLDLILEVVNPAAILKAVKAAWGEFQLLLGIYQQGSGLHDLDVFKSSDPVIKVAASQSGGSGGSSGSSRGSGGSSRPSPGAVSLRRGPSAPAGYRYAIALSGFAPNSAVSVSCRDSADPGGFYTFNLRTNGSGSGYTASACYSGDGSDHWVVAGGIESNHVSWTRSPPPSTTSTTAPQSAHPVFTVMNTSETLPDGVWFRNSPHTGDTDRVTGHGVYMGERVQLQCYAFGDVVGPYNDSLWYYVSNVSRPTNDGVANVGYLNAHYINDGKLANQIDDGVVKC